MEMIRCCMWVARVTSSMPLSLCEASIVASGVVCTESLIQSSSLGNVSSRTIVCKWQTYLYCTFPHSSRADAMSSQCLSTLSSILFLDKSCSGGKVSDAFCSEVLQKQS